VCVEVYKLFEQGKLAGAMASQSPLSQGDAGHTAAGIGATKCLVELFFDCDGVARSPLQPVSDEAAKSLADGIIELIEVKNSLSAK
jgi:L-threo-3-deoxy-hexylosonate aldolase